MNPPTTVQPDSPPGSPVTASPTLPTRPMYWSVRRELWESRSITIAPLAVAAIVLFASLISMIGLPGRMGALAADPARQHLVAVKPFSVAPAPIMFVTFLVGIFYCLDALHGERRDRSILFWKSLPVSDLTTVLSKASIPFAVLPLIGLVLSLWTLAILLLLSTAVLLAAGMSPATLWADLRLVQEPLVMLYGLTVHVLWFAPIYGWLLLVSAWARRMPVLWAALPPFAIALVEKIALGTSNFCSLLKYRVTGAMTEAFAVSSQRGEYPGHRSPHATRSGEIPEHAGPLDRAGARRGIPRRGGAAAPGSGADLMKIKRVLKWSAGAISLGLVAAAFVAYWTSTNDCGRITPTEGNLMKAIVYCDYGSPDVLKVEDVARPVPNDDQVLVKVRAASINPLEWHFMRGTPYVGRLMGMGLRKPKDTRLGVDVAGRVEAVGRNVTQFKPGDEVFGSARGALAEYVCSSERGLAVKPANVTFEQAASVSVAGGTALQGLRDKGKLQPGQKVLINGASGGVGTFAVQIAKAMGAEVTGVCSTRNVALVRSLGADHVIDYTKEDFTKAGLRYDLVLDMVGNHSLLRCRRVLEPKGRYVMVGGPKGRWIAPLDRALAAKVLSWFVSQEIGMMMANLNKKDLNVLRDLMEAGKVKPAVDRTYPLSQVSEAMRYLETGHARGKVVVTVSQ